MPALRRILHANDGSDQAFKALSFALDLAKQFQSELHMVSVEEISYVPEYIEDVREEKGNAARRFHTVIQRANSLAAAQNLKLTIHVLTGHPVRDIIRLSNDIAADLLVIGATGHSAFYERMIGSRADRLVQLAACPVLVVK